MKSEEHILALENATGYIKEDVMTADYYQWAYNTFPQIRKCIFHVPNGEQRSVLVGAKLQAMGVVAGVPDFIIFYAGRVALIELKLPKGVLSPAQKALHQIWRSEGFEIHVVRDFLTFKSIIHDILGIN